MKKLIMHNVGLKLLAVFFSCILWLIVVNFNDPVITISYSSIPVEILNSDVLVEQDKVFEVLDNTDTVTVYITATRSVLENISRDNVYAVADLQDISYLDTVRIQAHTNKNENDVNGIATNIENLKLEVEDMSRTQLVISSNVEGTPISGYIVSDINMDQNIVRLSGPESIISQVAKAVVDIDISGMSTTVNTSSEVKFYDVYNNRIENHNLISNINQVSISIHILETKSVPIVVNVTGAAAQGYATSGEYTVSPPSIQVAGTRNALESISSISVPENIVTIAGATDDVTQAVNISGYLPNSLRFVDENFNGYVNVTVGVEASISDMLEIDVSQISFLNAIDGYEASIELEDSLWIRVAGTEELVNNLDLGSITGTINLKDIATEEILVDTLYPATISWNITNNVQVSLLVDVYVSLVPIED